MAGQQAWSLFNPSPTMSTPNSNTQVEPASGDTSQQASNDSQSILQPIQKAKRLKGKGKKRAKSKMRAARGDRTIVPGNNVFKRSGPQKTVN